MASRETIAIAVKSVGRRVAKQRRELNGINKFNFVAVALVLAALALNFGG